MKQVLLTLYKDDFKNPLLWREYIDSILTQLGDKENLKKIDDINQITIKFNKVLSIGKW